jgi:hypothetical protein
MCWYSRYATLSIRNAIEGEELVVRDFPNLYHRWVVSPREPATTVCLGDACKLRLNDVPESLQKRLQVGSEVVAEFHEIYQPPVQSLFARILPRTFHYDVLVFPNGRCLEVALLPLGTRVDVLSAAVVRPVKEEKEEEKEEEEPETTYASRL